MNELFTYHPLILVGVLTIGCLFYIAWLERSAEQ